MGLPGRNVFVADVMLRGTFFKYRFERLVMCVYLFVDKLGLKVNHLDMLSYTTVLKKFVFLMLEFVIVAQTD